MTHLLSLHIDKSFKIKTLDIVFFGSPKGNRTPDTTVKGWCLNRLTMGPRRNTRFLSACSFHFATLSFARLLLLPLHTPYLWVPAQLLQIKSSDNAIVFIKRGGDGWN